MLTNEQQQKLKDVNRLFLEENQKCNLSAFRTEDACWVGNVLDSVAAMDVPVMQSFREGSLLDVGTGGGFPLLPLAICLPHVQCTGVDATRKKIDAIQRIADALELTNMQLVCERTETLGHDAAHREQYDMVTARAVASLPTLLEFTAPFVRPGGYILAWKSLNIDREIHDSLMARAELSCQLVDSYEYNLDDSPDDQSSERNEGAGWGKRQILVFEKRDALADKYPREIGIPKKHPLL